MTGTVVEIGPGTGVNMRFYADDVRVVAVEPNRNMHGPLQGSAAEHDVDLEIRTVQGERIDLDAFATASRQVDAAGFAALRMLGVPACCHHRSADVS